MNYADNKKNLQIFYDKLGLASKFDEDNLYLENAFTEINKLWVENFDKIRAVNYLMIAEAPLWGKTEKYIYNPDINNSQFFYRSDLGDILDRRIVDKMDFIKVCNEIGFLIVDISPFPLNEKHTSINYRDLKISQYRELVSMTIPTYFEKKIKKVATKKSKDIKTFFRYARVKNSFQDLITKVLIDNRFIQGQSEIGDISQNGGCIDKWKLSKIIK